MHFPQLLSQLSPWVVIWSWDMYCFGQSRSQLGLSLGPVIGGLLAQYLGWRAIFWFRTIFAAALLTLFILYFSKTSRHVVWKQFIFAAKIEQICYGLHQAWPRRRVWWWSEDNGHSMRKVSPSISYQWFAHNCCEKCITPYARQCNYFCGSLWYYCSHTLTFRQGLWIQWYTYQTLLPTDSRLAWNQNSQEPTCDLASFPIEKARLQIMFLCC